MQTTLQSLKVRQANFSFSITHYTLELGQVCSSTDRYRTRLVIHELNSRLYIQMKSVKEDKLVSLCNKQLPRQINNNAVSHNDKLVVTIPTDLELTDAEKSVLGRGLTFVPVERNINVYKTKAECERFYRLLRLKAHYHGREKNDTIATPDDGFDKFNRKISTWTPADGKFSAVDHYIDRCRRSVDSLTFEGKTFHNNLLQVEKEALRNLSKRDGIVIKPADKGGAVVVWSRPLYIQEALRHLSDGRFYERLDNDPLKQYQCKVKATVDDMISKDELPPSAKNLIVTTPATSRFYLLPKIHKPGNPGRPIVSACNCPTENIAAFLDEVMSPLVTNLASYVKDTNHALEIVNSFNFNNSNPDQRFLFTMDVKSLYTVIPNDSGLQALAYFLDKRPVLDPPTSTLTRLAELVLTLNAFSFDNQYYRQVGGVAMGSRMGPNYACLFVGYIEEHILSTYTGYIPQLYKRYIDDIVGAASCRREELEDFITHVSTFHPALQFTHTISQTQLPFLDINLSISDSRISTSVHYKDTDTHTYLHYTSSHPLH